MGGPSEMFPGEARSLGLCILGLSQYQRLGIIWDKTGSFPERDTAPGSQGVSERWACSTASTAPPRSGSMPASSVLWQRVVCEDALGTRLREGVAHPGAGVSTRGTSWQGKRQVPWPWEERGWASLRNSQKGYRAKGWTGGGHEVRRVVEPECFHLCLWS